MHHIIAYYGTVTLWHVLISRDKPKEVAESDADRDDGKVEKYTAKNNGM